MNFVIDHHFWKIHERNRTDEGRQRDLKGIQRGTDKRGAGKLGRRQDADGNGWRQGGENGEIKHEKVRLQWRQADLLHEWNQGQSD